MDDVITSETEMKNAVDRAQSAGFGMPPPQLVIDGTPMGVTAVRAAVYVGVAAIGYIAASTVTTLIGRKLRKPAV